MSSSFSSHESSSRAHSFSSTSLSSSRSSSSFFYHGSDASSSHTDVSSSPPGSPNLQTSSKKTKDFIAAASAKLSKAREQVSHALSDTTPKDSKFRYPINPAIIEEDVGYESDGDIRGANMKVSSSTQKVKPKFLRVDTKQHKQAASILSLHPFSVTTKPIAPNSDTTHKRSLARLDIISNTRAIPDYELTPITLSKPPAGLGLALPSVYFSKPTPRACTMPTLKSSGHNLKDSLPHCSPNLPPQTPHLCEPPKVYLRPIELPGTPSPMEYLPPSIIMCRDLSGAVRQSSSVLPSLAERMSPLWTVPPLKDFAPPETIPQSPLLLCRGSGGGWNPYFPSI
ncbi:hypothetical protein BDR07DRAFT_1476930 [Suillus spraguei]|nr:hypothetical protein BDR07DRAFT_1476930 [Suillus spraguei]